MQATLLIIDEPCAVGSVEKQSPNIVWKVPISSAVALAEGVGVGVAISPDAFQTFKPTAIAIARLRTAAPDRTFFIIDAT